MNKTKRYLAFDVESVGIHGEAFAFGYVVFDLTGKIYREGLFSCPRELCKGEDDDRAWIDANIAPLPITCSNPFELREEFWKIWTLWKSESVSLVTDCGWPVESRFLIACIDDNPIERNWEGPLPILDIAPMLALLGRDPIATRDRQSTELPVHNPLADSKQTARLMRELFLTPDLIT